MKCPTCEQNFTGKMILHHMINDHKWRLEDVIEMYPQLISRWIGGRLIAAHWQDPQYAHKILKSVQRCPTQPELALNDILDKNFPNQFKYVGDGTMWKTAKNEDGRFCYLNPDFISTNGEKLVIEVFGTYWHNKARCAQRPMAGEQFRRKLFASLGYKMLVIWEHEMHEPDKVLQKINEFVS